MQIILMIILKNIMCDGKETVGCNGKREEQADMEHEKKDIGEKCSIS